MFNLSHLVVPDVLEKMTRHTLRKNMLSSNVLVIKTVVERQTFTILEQVKRLIFQKLECI